MNCDHLESQCEFCNHTVADLDAYDCETNNQGPGYWVCANCYNQAMTTRRDQVAALEGALRRAGEALLSAWEHRCSDRVGGCLAISATAHAAALEAVRRSLGRDEGYEPWKCDRCGAGKGTEPVMSCYRCSPAPPYARAAPKKALPGKSLKAKRVEKRQTRKEKTASVRAAVFARAEGQCECCTAYVGGRGVLDHWLGGSGRRRALESAETTWLLCGPCNERRTNNVPSAAHWNREFEAHCDIYGYPFTPHKERK